MYFDDPMKLYEALRRAQTYEQDALAEFCAESFHASPDYFLRAVRRTAHFRNLSNIFENIRETRRFEIYDLWRPGQRRGEPRHRSVTDRANIAQFLGQDQIGPQFAQERLVDRINRARFAQRAPDPFIHFAAR